MTASPRSARRPEKTGSSLVRAKVPWQDRRGHLGLPAAVPRVGSTIGPLHTKTAIGFGPGGRQRAYNDALRDLVTPTLGHPPVIRVAAPIATASPRTRRFVPAFERPPEIHDRVRHSPRRSGWWPLRGAERAVIRSRPPPCRGRAPPRHVQAQQRHRRVRRPGRCGSSPPRPRRGQPAARSGPALASRRAPRSGDE